MTLESYLVQKFRIASLIIDKWGAELDVNSPGSNGEEKKVLKNIYLKLAISYAILGDFKKSKQLESLAEQYM